MTTRPLAAGAAMPALLATDLEGERRDMVASVAGSFAAVLLYRGHW